MFRFIKNIYWIISVVNASSHTKCVFLSNKKCLTKPTLTNLHPNECTQGLHYYLFAVNLDTCGGRCNILNSLSNKGCLPNKT